MLETLLNAASLGVDKATEFPLQPRYHGADHETLSVPFGMGKREFFGRRFLGEDVFLLGGLFVNQNATTLLYTILVD